MRLMGWPQPFAPIRGAFRRTPKSAFGAEGGTAGATSIGRGLEAFDMAIPSIVPGGASGRLATDLHAKRIILDLDEWHTRLARLAELRAVQRDQ
jgi:hypothetical protein